MNHNTNSLRALDNLSRWSKDKQWIKILFESSKPLQLLELIELQDILKSTDSTYVNNIYEGFELLTGGEVSLLVLDEEKIKVNISSGSCLLVYKDKFYIFDFPKKEFLILFNRINQVINIGINFLFEEDTNISDPLLGGQNLSSEYLNSNVLTLKGSLDKNKGITILTLLIENLDNIKIFYKQSSDLLKSNRIKKSLPSYIAKRFKRDWFALHGDYIIEGLELIQIGSYLHLFPGIVYVEGNKIELTSTKIFTIESPNNSYIIFVKSSGDIELQDSNNLIELEVDSILSKVDNEEVLDSTFNPIYKYKDSSKDLQTSLKIQQGSRKALYTLKEGLIRSELPRLTNNISNKSLFKRVRSLETKVSELEARYKSLADHKAPLVGTKSLTIDLSKSVNTDWYYPNTNVFAIPDKGLSVKRETTNLPLSLESIISSNSLKQTTTKEGVTKWIWKDIPEIHKDLVKDINLIEVDSSKEHSYTLKEIEGSIYKVYSYRTLDTIFLKLNTKDNTLITDITVDETPVLNFNIIKGFLADNDRTLITSEGELILSFPFISDNLSKYKLSFKIVNENKIIDLIEDFIVCPDIASNTVRQRVNSYGPTTVFSLQIELSHSISSSQLNGKIQAWLYIPSSSEYINCEVSLSQDKYLTLIPERPFYVESNLYIYLSQIGFSEIKLKTTNTTINPGFETKVNSNWVNNPDSLIVKAKGIEHSNSEELNISYKDNLGINFSSQVELNSLISFNINTQNIKDSQIYIETHNLNLLSNREYIPHINKDITNSLEYWWNPDTEYRLTFNSSEIYSLPILNLSKSFINIDKLNTSFNWISKEFAVDVFNNISLGIRGVNISHSKIKVRISSNKAQSWEDLVFDSFKGVWIPKDGLLSTYIPYRDVNDNEQALLRNTIKIQVEMNNIEGNPILEMVWLSLSKELDPEDQDIESQ